MQIDDTDLFNLYIVTPPNNARAFSGGSTAPAIEIQVHVVGNVNFISSMNTGIVRFFSID